MNNPQTQGSTGSGLGSGATEGGDLKSSLGSVAEQAKAQGQERIESTRQATATTLEKLAEGVRDAASELQRDGTVGNLSGYIVQMSESLTSVASGLRDKSGDDLVHEIGRIARENPTVFVAGAVALGFGLTRFARASTHRDQGESSLATQGGADVGSDLAGSATDIGASSLSSAGERGGADTVYSAGSLGGASTGSGSTLASGATGSSSASASSTGAASGSLSSASSGAGLSSTSDLSQGFPDTASSTSAGSSSGIGLSGSDATSGLETGADRQQAGGSESTPGLGTGTTPGLSAGPGASLGVRSGETGGQGA